MKDTERERIRKKDSWVEKENRTSPAATATTTVSNVTATVCIQNYGQPISNFCFINPQVNAFSQM